MRMKWIEDSIRMMKQGIRGPEDKMDDNHQDSKQSTAFTTLKDSQLWLLQKMQTKQQFSNILNSVATSFVYGLNKVEKLKSFKIKRKR